MAQTGSYACRLRSSCLQSRIQGVRFGTRLKSGCNACISVGPSYIVCSHQTLFEMNVSSSYLFTVVHVKSPQCIDLVVQMTSQRLSKRFDKTPQLPSVIVFGRTSPSIVFKYFKSRRERSMLLYVALHKSFDLGDLLDAREEVLFLCIVVVMHRLRPALAIC